MGLLLMVYYSYDSSKPSVDYRLPYFLVKGTEQLMKQKKIYHQTIPSVLS